MISEDVKNVSEDTDDNDEGMIDENYDPDADYSTGSQTEKHITTIGLKIVSMIRKYHKHKLQTHPWHREEEPQNNHETPGRQTKQCNQLALPY